MFLEVICIALLVYLVKGGKLSKLIDLDIKKAALIYLLLFLNLGMLLVYYRTNFIYKEYLPYLNILIYLIYISLLLYNIKLKGAKILLVGTILNFIPLLFYRGKMPVDIVALEKIGAYPEIELLFQDKVLTHCLLNLDSKIKLFSDFIAIGKPYFFPKVISIGDIFLAIGIFMFIYSRTKDLKEE